jgi:hypothetical protein
MIRVIAKGTPEEIEAAAAKFGVTLVVIRQRDGELTGLAPDADEGKIAEWFCSDVSDGPPFPPGSCLWHGRDQS